MTLNEYIIEHSDRGAGEDFLHRFSKTEVFFSLPDASRDLADGLMEFERDTEMALQIATLDVGRMAIFYASKNDPRLTERFAGMPLIRAAQLVCDLSQVDGMLLQSEGSAWFVARKEALRRTIGQVRDDVLIWEIPVPDKEID